MKLEKKTKLPYFCFFFQDILEENISLDHQQIIIK